MGVPQNRWFMENAIKMDDLGVPPFQESSIYPPETSLNHVGNLCWNQFIMIYLEFGAYFCCSSSSSMWILGSKESYVSWIRNTTTNGIERFQETNIDGHIEWRSKKKVEFKLMLINVGKTV